MLLIFSEDVKAFRGFFACHFICLYYSFVIASFDFDYIQAKIVIDKLLCISSHTLYELKLKTRFDRKTFSHFHKRNYIQIDYIVKAMAKLSFKTFIFAQ